MINLNTTDKEPILTFCSDNYQVCHDFKVEWFKWEQEPHGNEKSKGDFSPLDKIVPVKQEVISRFFYVQ